MTLKVRKIAHKLHIWAGAVLAVQILFWIAGGLIMSAIPLERVHGKHLATKQSSIPFKSADFTYSIDEAITAMSFAPTQIVGAYVLESPYYILSNGQHSKAIHAKTGKALGALSAQQVNKIAAEHYLGKANIYGTELLTDVPPEASRNMSPVWQVTYDDRWQTTLYISNYTGQVTTIRSHIWRIFDFVWMLHIMDYDDREDFNNPLLISFAAASLLFTLSGFTLLFYKLRIRRTLQKIAIR
ncbi:MAG: hypothetical protein WA981_15725 [Glaciecola sp.]